VTCDLKSPEGREVVHALLADADVFVQNLAPGAAKRLGWTPRRCRPRIPAHRDINQIAAQSWSTKAGTVQGSMPSSTSRWPDFRR
jgi:hypothetical protein